MLHTLGVFAYNLAGWMLAYNIWRQWFKLADRRES